MLIVISFFFFLFVTSMVSILNPLVFAENLILTVKTCWFNIYYMCIGWGGTRFFWHLASFGLFPSPALRWDVLVLQTSVSVLSNKHKKIQPGEIESNYRVVIVSSADLGRGKRNSWGNKTACIPIKYSCASLYTFICSLGFHLASWRNERAKGNWHTRMLVVNFPREGTALDGGAINERVGTFFESQSVKLLVICRLSETRSPTSVPCVEWYTGAICGPWDQESLFWTWLDWPNDLWPYPLPPPF